MFESHRRTVDRRPEDQEARIRSTVRTTQMLKSKLPIVGTTIFTVMSKLAADTRRDQSLAGIPGLRLRPGAGGGGRAAHARRAQPVRADAGRAGAAPGDRREVPRALRRGLRPRHRGHRDLRRHRRDLRRGRRGRPSRRRGHRLRAVLRLVRAGDRGERRQGRSSSRCATPTTRSRGTRCARRSRRAPG